MLDVGGGLNALNTLIEEMRLVEMLERRGIRMVLMYVLGNERADLDYLERFAEDGMFMPKSTLLVFNAGLLTSGRSANTAFDALMMHPAVGKGTQCRGAHHANAGAQLHGGGHGPRFELCRFRGGQAGGRSSRDVLFRPRAGLALAEPRHAEVLPERPAGVDAGDQATARPEELIMDTLPERPAKPVALETAPIRADFQERLQALRDAARDWGLQPDHPEGVFVSTMIGTQAGFAELALSLAEALRDVVIEARATAEEELARQRVVTHETRIALEEARGAIENMERGARGAIQNLEVEKEKVTAQLIDRIVPDMIRGTRDALVIREHRHNRNVEWARALGAGALMLGLVLLGYGWGTWSDWGMTSRIESIGRAIERCDITSKWTDDSGHRLCEMSDFVSN